MKNQESAEARSKQISEGGIWAMSAWSIIAAFGTYFCMYAFRKPFAVAKYEHMVLWGMDYKTVLVTAQVIGYTLSKFCGIKVIAEITRQRRIVGIFVLIAVAEAALLAFAVVPPPYNFICLFVNGLPLGMVFGMVLGFLEGRQVTELLAAGLCASFILADGATKSLGAYLLAWHVPEAWMPCTAGLIAVVPMAIFVWMLSRIPAPSAADVAQRTARVPMDGRQRWRFFWTYAPGLTTLLLMYMLITVLRSIRSDFAAEIWSGLLGKAVKTPPQAFATSEVVVALMVMLANGLCFLIKDSRTAFFTSLGIGACGTALVVACVAGMHYGLLDGFTFMVLVGIGLYLPYVAVQTTIFERLIAMTHERSNLGYLIYLADAFGYLGYPVFMLVQRYFEPKPDFLRLFAMTSTGMAIIAFGCLLFSGYYFRRVGVGKTRGDAVASLLAVPSAIEAAATATVEAE
jgi:hypothetical protein